MIGTRSSLWDLVRVIIVAMGFAMPWGTVEAHDDAEIVDAALTTYVHGMTDAIAQSTVGAEGVPVLVRLLTDASFPRRDNVVAYLAYLGGDAEADALVGFLRQPPNSLDVPEEDRAALLVPEALGRIAGRGHARALAVLLAMTEDGANGGVLGAAAAHARRPDAMRRDLLEMAVRALGFAGAGARARIDDIVAGRVVPAPGLARAAERARGLAAAPAPANGDEGVGGVAGATQGDPSPDAHAFAIDFANHVDHPSPIGDGRVDDILDAVSVRVGRADSPIANGSDSACCVRFERAGVGGTFGSPGDGDDIMVQSNVGSLLDHPSARVKVIRQISYCSGPGTNIIGCGWIGANGVAVVRFATSSDPAIEGALWVHEVGHNVGLNHNGLGADWIMNSGLGSANRGVTSSECASYHAPGDGTVPAVSAACTDQDADAVQDDVDNCPTVANTDQTDANGDGIGDACEVGCGNGSIDAGEQCDGGDLGGASCATLGFDAGTLSCNLDCTFDVRSCSTCGNGVAEGGEACDLGDLAGASCADVDCAAGAPTCFPDCTLDYGLCTECLACNTNGVCDVDDTNGQEDCTSCPSDCVSGAGAGCGNGVCEPAIGEDCLACAADCRGKQNGKPSARYCCGDGAGQGPVGCSDARCAQGEWACSDAPGDPFCCGDGTCAPGSEDGFNCAADCGAPPSCGDGTCNGAEDECACAADCGNPPSGEAGLCTDGVDNDCGGGVDCADDDCAGDPACQQTCAPVGASCTSDSDCCGFKCRGRSGGKTCK